MGSRAWVDWPLHTGNAGKNNGWRSQDLNALITKVSGDVDTLIARPSADPTAVPAAQVAAATASLQTIDDKITAALTPVST